MHLLLNPLSLTDDQLPVQPTHIASWSIDSPAGPSRRVALASPDNSIWIHTSPLLPPVDLTPPAPSQPLPSITTSAPPRRPSSPPTARQSKPRSRAPSSTSSILTKSSKRRAAAFSPPSSAVQLPTTSLASATALPAGPDEHGHSSISEREGLLEHLREQAKEEEDERPLTRLTGLARRGLPGLHGKEEHEVVEGTTSPRSTVSVDSSRTFTDIFGWKRGDEEERRQKELKEKIEEIDVEREIERETREEEREKQEAKVIEAAQRPGRKPRHKRTKTLDLRGDGYQPNQVLRVVLPQSDRGTIACMKVFDGVGLVILRDVGILDVYSTVDFKRLRSVDLESASNGSSSSKSLHLSPFWFWRTLHEVELNNDKYMVADGIPWPCDMPSPNGEVTHVVVVSCDTRRQDQITHLDLPGIGHIGITTSAAPPQSHVLHFLPDTLTSYPLQIATQSTKAPAPPERYNSPLPRAVTAAFTSQNLSLLRPSTPNPTSVGEAPLRKNKSFTSLRPDSADRPGIGTEDRGLSGLLGRRKAPKSPTVPETTEPSLELGEGREVERDGYGQWTGLRISEGGEGVGWSDEAVDIFTCDGKHLSVKTSITMSKRTFVKNVLFSREWQDVAVQTANHTVVYRSERVQKLAKDAPTFAEHTRLPEALCLGMESKNVSLLLATSADLSCMGLSGIVEAPSHIVEFSKPLSNGTVVPLENDRAVNLDDRGNASSCTLGEIISSTDQESTELGADRLDARVTVAKNIVAAEDFFAVGDEDGAIRVWTTRKFDLQGSWTCFADPVIAIALLDGPESASLFCVSVNGTIALINLELMDLLYLIPASRAPLRRAFVGGNDLLLAYANGKARVWNLKTCEFRRSTGLDAADDMLQSGEWAEIDMHSTTLDRPLSSTTGHSPPCSDLGRLLEVDLRAFEQSVQRSVSGSPLSLARNLLSLIVSWDVEKSIDRTCIEQLGLQRPKAPVSVSTQLDDATFTSAQGSEVWRISPEATAMRQLYIVTLIRTFLFSPDHEKAAAEVIAYYTVTILDLATPPDLEFFVEYYVDPIANIQQSARMLFAARLASMTESQIETVVDTHKQNLPNNVSTELQQSEAAVQALTLIGAIALHQYESLSPSVLKDVAESIHLYIADVTCPHLAIAIELASKVFTTWQTYLDPMEMLRLLFYLSTHTPPPPAISAQARIAVLHVASTNPALFMSTLSMDILDAKTTEGRTSIMKLCVYMARKNPSVLENGLPRIAEAVVKSLDPNIGKMREDVREAATVILNELVLAFTTIDFHSATQRLAVGTHEGAVIMYDLKSASRLYVLESHQGPVSSVNFSPDGRRLLTVSLEDGDVTVWKVGSSLSGFFNVGGPPRQGAVGAGKGGPFKRIPFRRADDEPLVEISALSDIKVEWPGERTARVMIRETALTFET